MRAAMSLPNDDLKRAAGFAAVDRYVRDGTCIGLGTGTTARWAVGRVGERVAAGERIEAVATSEATAAQCRALGIPLVPYGVRDLDVAIDGADEVAADWSLTKGGGGALFREKAVALMARRFVVIVTPEKPCNVCFGAPDRMTLYITAQRSLYSIPVLVPGIIFQQAEMRQPERLCQ